MSKMVETNRLIASLPKEGAHMGGSMARRSALAAVFAACLLLAALATSCERDASESTGLEHATVVRVVDGDTVEIDRGSGAESVRLIGIDAPESKNPDEGLNSEEGRMASLFLEGELAPGMDVYLEADVSDTDRYGRLLRYVWDELPVSREADAECKMINARIVVAGYAQAKRYPPDTRYAEELERLQMKAAERDAGVSYLWASAD